MDAVCNIEIIKDGMHFEALVQLANGLTKEYHHQNFEDMLTEMAIALQDELDE